MMLCSRDVGLVEVHETFAEPDPVKISKGWSLAMDCSERRLLRIHGSRYANLVDEKILVLETLCLLIHASLRPGQYR